jgi:Skp family chaperone for outer membrane proteins
MAGFMDMLGKRPEGESAGAYQKIVLKEIARKLTELEEQNDVNSTAIDEIKRLQKMMLQKVDVMNTGVADVPYQPEPVDCAGSAEVEALRNRVDALAAQISENSEELNAKLQSILDMLAEEKADNTAGLEDRIKDKLDTMKLSIVDTVHKENIKCYRNIQGAIEEQGDVKEYDVKGLKKYLKVVVWFQLMVIVLLVLRILGLL